MKAVVSILGAFALALYIFSTDVTVSAEELPPNFIDLPDDLRLDTLQHLDLKDLIRLSKTHPQYRKLIETAFKNKFNDHELHIAYSNWTSKISINYDKMNIATIPYGESNADFEEVLDFLQYFGHCIHKVILWNDFMDKQLGETLHKQISKYVAKSVNAIEYQMRDALNSMRDLMVPYPNVESAKLYGGDFDVEIDDETLHQMFPAVRTLDLNSMEMHESLSYFPTLERLTIPQNLATNQSDLPLLERTLELNPSFKHLIIRNCSHWNVLQAVNRIRPDLESLEFAYQNIVGHNARAEPMYFPNMKFFKCVMWPGFRSEGSVRIPPLKFGNLEEIEFEHKHLVDYWLDILMQNKNLRKLSASFELEHEHLKQIANGLPNLEEFKMLCSFAGPKPLRTIVDFLRSANQLKKAAFGELREKDCAKAAEQLKGNWEKVKAIRKSTCLLVRKTL